MRHYFGCTTFTNRQETCEGALDCCSYHLPLLLDVVHVFFLKRSSQCSQYLHIKSTVEWIEGTLGKTTYQHCMAPNYSDTCISARLGNDPGNGSELCYATQVWSPAYITLNATVEQAQRRASRWILRTGKDESSYKERLILLHLLPLSLDRELKYLIFFINAFTVVPI